jgi:hypothetical protein
MSRRFGTASKLLLAAVLCTSGMLLLNVNKASANHVGIPGGLPANLRTYLQQNCGHSGQSPAFVQWVSSASNPTSTVVNVAYGAPSVALSLHFSGVVCYGNSAVPESRLGVLGSSANPPGVVSGINGAVLRLNFGSAYQNVGTYRTAADSFTYSPAGGFTRSGVYRITLDNRVINRFSSGAYGCVAGGGNPGGWNYAACRRDPPGFDILINVGPPPVVSCNGVTFNPAGNPEAGQPFTVTGGFSVSGEPGPNMSAAMSVVIPTLGVNQVLFLGSVGRNSSTNRTSASITAPAGDHSGYFEVFVPNGRPQSLRCPFSLRVVDKPYYRVYGGDVFAGAGFQDGTACTTDQQSSIIAWNRASNPYLGAGSQLGTFALGTIVDFASGTLRNRNLPKSQTFANANPSFNNWGAGGFGGGLDAGAGNAICAADYWADATNIRLSGFAINTPRNFGMGQRETIYVDGDVYINRNVTYAAGAYNNVNQIPSFRIVARGNIYVAPGVTELNGVYIAMPRAGSNNTGRFYTCWPGRIPTAADMNGACRTNRLTVYGAVVAELIKFTRSLGTLSGSTISERYDSGIGTPAEVFIYTPEVWLVNGFGADGGTVDSITAQPPVL